MTTLAYRAEIDGLRALAIISVIIFHLNENWLPGGFVGVDIFFVISGYLIASIVMTASYTNAAEFIVKRVKRTLPVCFVVLFMIMMVGVAVMPAEELYQLSKKLSAAVFQVSNFMSLSKDPYFNTDSLRSPTLHTWSLGVEWQFYLLVGFLVLVVKGKKRLPIAHNIMLVIAILSFSFALFVSFNEDPKWNRHAYYSPFSRLWEFYIGIAVAYLVYTKVKRFTALASYAGISLIVCSFFLISSSSAFPGVAALMPTLGTGMVIYGTQTQNSVQRLLKLRLFVLIGLISYSLYLWHWPVLAFVRYLWSDNTLTPLTMVCCLLAILALSICSYRLIEVKRFAPGRKHSVWSTGGMKYSFGLTVLLALLAVSTRGFATFDSSEQEPRQQITCNKNSTGSCGDLLSDRKVLLYGDSHAGHFATVFNDLAEKTHKQLTIKHIPGCAPVPTEAPKQKPECDTLYGYLEQSAEHFSVVAVSVRWENYSINDQYKKRLSQALEKLVNHADRVFVLGQIPSYLKIPKPAVFMNERYGLDMDTDVKMSPSWLVANQKIEQLVEQTAGVSYVDTAAFFCTAGNLCSPFIGETLAYEDDNHITVFGSMQMSDFFEQNIFF